MVGALLGGVGQGLIGLAEMRNLKRAVVIESPDGTDLIAIGSLVTVAEPSFPPEQFRIVGSAEANPSLGLISNESLLGRALLGKRVGQVASYTAPDGEPLSFEIIEIRAQRGPTP